MSCRQIIIGCLIFATLVIPIVQLSFGFHFINDTDLCPIQRDIMLLMGIGGVFEAIFFAAMFGFLYKSTPAKYKIQKNQSVAQMSAKGSNRASSIIIGCITGILGACATMFFVLLQIQVYKSFKTVQSTDTTTTSTYCLFTIFSSAFGLIIATYVAIFLLIIVSIVLLCGIGVPKK